MTQNIHFHNDTDLPIMIDAWTKNHLKSTRVAPKETILLYSSVGEWHINSMFDDPIDNAAWKDAGLKKYLHVGKFRSDPCASGNYSWLEYDDDKFNIEYSKKDDNIVRGVITFSLNN